MIEEVLVYTACAFFFYRVLDGLIRLAKWVYRWSTEEDLTRYRSVAQWAVITGCTDGIGLEFARQLRRRGFNLILVSRSQDKLDNLKEELISYTAAVPTAGIVTLQMDFSQSYDEGRVKAVIGRRCISILINNVGVGYEKNMPFSSLSASKLTQIVQVNITSTLLFTQSILPLMSAGKGLVVNVSSGSSLAPCPYMSVYAASKAFLNAWSNDMALEYEGRIVFQLYTPYYITSKLSHFTKATMTIPSPAHWVATALTQMGRTTTTGYPIHDMMCWVLNSLMSTSMKNRYLLSANKPSDG